MSRADPDCTCSWTPRRLPHRATCPRFDEDRAWSIADRADQRRRQLVRR